MAQREPSLLRFLAQDAQYHAQAARVRDLAQRWLSYVPASFPNYTRHTIDHSDAIVDALSTLLFEDGAATPKTLPSFSAAEAFILVVAAYLHDAGMVISESEKRRLIATGEFAEWLHADNERLKTYEACETLRASPVPPDPLLRSLVADWQLRLLLASYYRGLHHIRSGMVLQTLPELQAILFSDPELCDTVAAVCESHGLNRSDLLDDLRFPERRLIRGEMVNVRLLASLLRIGDLLDLSFERACPLLVGPASPIPADSRPHWSQYHCVKSRLFAPDRIELNIECSSQEEHRLLLDWCSWIVEEVSHSATISRHSSRHSDWQAPRVSLNTPSPTITIRPAASATYKFIDWKLSLDQSEIINRLINDVSTDPLSFVRELLQNACDATRCRLVVEKAIPGPEQAPAIFFELGADYPIEVRVTEQDVENDLTGGSERVQVIEVTDCGTGMNTETVSKYLLQIGRSYYRSESFLKRFSFTPTSRFGVGFLSVFSLSDHVVVDTYRPDTNSQPLSLTLRGPRSYFLVDRGDRRDSGTTVRVRLRSRIPEHVLTEYVKRTCLNVEFPIRVTEGAETTEVTRTFLPNDQLSVPDESTAGAVLAVRSFSLKGPEYWGCFHILARVDGDNESWVSQLWLINGYRTAHPVAKIPAMPKSALALHGIEVKISQADFLMHATIDYRGTQLPVSLARDSIGFASLYDLLRSSEVSPIVEQIIREHLGTTGCARGRDGWKYLHRICQRMGATSIWSDIPSIPLWHLGQERTERMPDVARMEDITVIGKADRRRWRRYQSEFDYPDGKIDSESPRHILEKTKTSHTGPLLSDEDVGLFAPWAVDAIFKHRKPTNVAFLSDGYFAVTWTSVPGREQNELGWLHAFPIEVYPELLLMRTTETVFGHTPTILVNVNHPLGRWLAETGRQSLEDRTLSSSLSPLTLALENGTNSGNFSAVEAFLHGIGTCGGRINSPPRKGVAPSECLLL